MASIGFSGARRSLARILVVAAALGAAAPASAQWLGFFDGGTIPPAGIVRSLMNRGFVEIGRPRLAGEVYVVEGVNARGTRLRLVIDAYDGSLVSRTRLDVPLVPPAAVGRGRRATPPDGFGAPFEDEAFAPPPREARRINPAPRQPSAAAPQRKPAKAAEPRAVPPAPAAPVEAAKPQSPKTETAKAEPPKAEPAAVPPAPAKPPEAPAPAAAKPAEPPAQEPPQRSVRVIEGVTPVVPQPAEPATPAEEKKPEITPPATLE